LSGRILPVSGIREKVLAAKRAGVKIVVFPTKNQVDVENLPEQLTAGLRVVLAEEIDELIPLALPRTIS
jgi:ATP-dependent Lon protease